MLNFHQSHPQALAQDQQHCPSPKLDSAVSALGMCPQIAMPVNSKSSNNHPLLLTLLIETTPLKWYSLHNSFQISITNFWRILFLRTFIGLCSCQSNFFAKVLTFYNPRKFTINFFHLRFFKTCLLYGKKHSQQKSFFPLFPLN